MVSFLRCTLNLTDDIVGLKHREDWCKVTRSKVGNRDVGWKRSRVKFSSGDQNSKLISVTCQRLWSSFFPTPRPCLSPNGIKRHPQALARHRQPKPDSKN